MSGFGHYKSAAFCKVFEGAIQQTKVGETNTARRTLITTVHERCWLIAHKTHGPALVPR